MDFKLCEKFGVELHTMPFIIWYHAYTRIAWQQHLKGSFEKNTQKNWANRSYIENNAI